MKKVVILAVFFSLFIVACSNEMPEAPKPKASVGFDIEQRPFSFYWNSWYQVWYMDIYILITENAGVGATINQAKVEWILNNANVAQSLHQGGTLPPSGSLRVHIYSECPGKYRVDKIRISITGRDNNGHDIAVSHEYAITWTTQQAIRLF